MRNDKSPHILNASSNLLGLCFVVLTSLKFLNLNTRTYIDETVTVALLFFMLSVILSFLSIRGTIRPGNKFEVVADYLFLGGMGVLSVTSVLLFLNLIG